MQMLTNGADNQFQKPIAVCFSEESLCHVEQGTKRRNTRGISFALIICQRLSYSLEKFLTGIKRLQKETIYTLAQRLDGGLNRAEAGHDQDRSVRLNHLSAGDHVKAIYFRHTNINDEQIKALLLRSEEHTS